MATALAALGSGLLLGALRVASPRPGLPARPPVAPPTPSALSTSFSTAGAPGCDFNYLRTQLTWVNYVRDRTAAQVHVIATALGTGSGGYQVKLEYIGAQEFAGVDDQLKYDTPAGASGDELRQEFARVLKMGLARYVLRTRFGRNLVVSYLASQGAPPDPRARDPWNFWVFSIGFSGSLNGQSQSNGRSGSGSVLCIPHHRGVEVPRQLSMAAPAAAATSSTTPPTTSRGRTATRAARCWCGRSTIISRSAAASEA